MRNKFDEQLQTLNQEIIEMGNKICESIKLAIEAFLSQDIGKAKTIVENDSLIDHLQKKIESICFNLLIQQQPVAKDLRAVTAALKMVTDMERIGDHAADISELTVLIGKNGKLLNFNHLTNMASETMIMLNRAIEAYVEKDIVKTEEVIKHDDIVDELFLMAKKDIVETISKYPDKAEESTDYLMIAKYFERIGDHATNIAEWVMYSLNRQ